MNEQTGKNEIASSSAHSLDELIPAAEGGIVSRTLVDRPAGTVTLFAFDAGQGLSEHSAPYDALVQLTAGRLQLTIDGEPLELAAGQVCLMPADVPHALRAVEPSRMLLVMIRG